MLALARHQRRLHALAALHYDEADPVVAPRLGPGAPPAADEKDEDEDDGAWEDEEDEEGNAAAAAAVQVLATPPRASPSLAQARRQRLVRALQAASGPVP
jgi:hypothetical protein